MATTWRMVDGQGRPQAGAKRYIDRLGRIPVKVRPRISAANEKSSEDLAAMMVRLAPRDRGDLERSIVYYQVTGTVGAGIVWRVAAGDDKAFQARWVEFGTPNMAAQPFFYPSYRALRRLIRSRQVRAFRQGMKDSKAP